MRAAQILREGKGVGTPGTIGCLWLAFTLGLGVLSETHYQSWSALSTLKKEIVLTVI